MALPPQWFPTKREFWLRSGTFWAIMLSLLLVVLRWVIADGPLAREYANTIAELVTVPQSTLQWVAKQHPPYGKFAANTIYRAQHHPRMMKFIRTYGLTQDDRDHAVKLKRKLAKLEQELVVLLAAEPAAEPETPQTNSEAYNASFRVLECTRDVGECMGDPNFATTKAMVAKFLTEKLTLLSLQCGFTR